MNETNPIDILIEATGNHPGAIVTAIEIMAQKSMTAESVVNWLEERGLPKSASESERQKWFSENWERVRGQAMMIGVSFEED